MKDKDIAAIIWLMVITAILLSWLTGCTTQRKVEKWNKKHPDKAAQYCADTWPEKDSVITIDSIHFDTLFIEGEPVVIRDSFYIKGDTIVKVVVKECPKVSQVVITKTHDSIIYRRNTAYETTLQYKIAALERDVGAKDAALGAMTDELNDVKHGRSKWRLWCLITWGIIVAFFSIKILSPIKL